MKDLTKVAISAAMAAALVNMLLKYPAEMFIALVMGWIFVIPALFAGYLLHGLLASNTKR